MSAVNKVIPLTGTATGEVFNLSAGAFVKVSDNGAGSDVQYFDQQGATLKQIAVDEAASAIATASETLFACTFIVPSGTGVGYANACNVVNVTTNGSGAKIWYNQFGATNYELYVSNSRSTIITRIDALTTTVTGSYVDTSTNQTAAGIKTWSDQQIFSSINKYSNTTGITAFAGGEQGSATALTTEYNNITTCATAGDSVVLPAAAAGKRVIVKNNGATTAAVFPPSGGTIDGGAGNASISIDPGVQLMFSCINTSDWESNAYSFGAYTVTPTITAFAGGGQGSATQITSEFNNISVCATAGDSVKLPVASVGQVITIYNNGAASADVYPATSGTFNGGSANAAIKLPVGGSLCFTATSTTNWVAQTSVVLGTNIVAAKEVDHVFSVTTTTTAATAGGAITITSGAGATSGVGGALALNSGAGGSTGAGGAITITSGAATNATSGTAAASGAITITPGTSATATTGTGGAGATISITGKAGGAASGAAGIGGAGSAVTTVGGAGGASSDSSSGNAGAGGAISTTAGAGGAASGTGAATGGVGGAAGLVAGAGGAAAGTAAPGVGGAITITSGAGGAKSGTGNAVGAAGGAITVTVGAGGNTASNGANNAGSAGTYTITGGAGGNASAGTGDGGNGTSIVLNPGAGGTSAGGNAGKQGFVRTSKTFLQDHTTAAINSTGTATAAQAATGYITSTSAAGTTITLPTGTLLGAYLGATQGTIHKVYVDNTSGSNTVTIAVAVNGILSALAAANAGSAGLLTVPSGVTGQAEFTLMFSSATAYTFSRTA